VSLDKQERVQNSAVTHTNIIGIIVIVIICYRNCIRFYDFSVGEEMN